MSKIKLKLRIYLSQIHIVENINRGLAEKMRISHVKNIFSDATPKNKMGLYQNNF